jgi:peptide/nickel transport system permease protein
MSETAVQSVEVKPISRRPGVWARLRRNHLAVFGLVIVVVISVIALLAPLLPLPDPDVTDLGNRLHKVFTEGHLLGTDHLGRDILSRIIWGARVSLAVGIVATLIAAVSGSLIGILAGFYGRWIDNLLMRSIDMVMAFPYMLLALAIVAVLGPGLMNALYAIAIVNIPFFARSVRGMTLGLVRQEYVDAARLSGLSNLRILAGELLPNVLPVIIITMSTTVGWMILETAGLSFLGLGAQPPQADLGSMLGEGRKLMMVAPHVATIPGLVILVLVIGINLLGDGLRDVLDPRLKAGALVRPSAATEVDPKLKAAPPEKNENNALLSVANLKTNFILGDDIYQAVGGVDFQLKPGECLGIVGESGCGKSVTALSLLGLVPTPPGRIVDGRINYGDENLLQVSNERLSQIRGNRISYIFQDPLTTLNPLFTVGEQIAETIRRHQGLGRKPAMQRAIELMQMVQIPNARERAAAYPHELSGGMRQRIGIAMALANDPQIIIADEPTTALDVTVQAEILKLLDTLRHEQHLALIFITHDFGVVGELCDRMLVMYAGRVVEAGTTEEIFAQPSHPYTKQLMQCVPELGNADRKINAIPGLPPAVNDLPPGCAFAERCNYAIDACRQGEIELASLGTTHAARCIRVEEVRRA